MNDSHFIADQIRRAYQGDPWHGPNLQSVLEGVTAEQAAAYPILGAHSIWELVLHLAGWTGEVERRLGGALAGAPPQGDWPAQGSGEADWKAALEALAEAHESLARAAEAFPSDRWDEKVGDERNPPLGTGVSFRATLHGVAQHAAYHAGQIIFLKKALCS